MNGVDLFSSPPPLAPPTTEGNRLSWLRLLRSYRVGVSTFLKLMAEHDNDADAAIAALPKIAATAGIKDYAACTAAHAMGEMDRGRRAGAVAVFRGEPAYPAALADLADAPIMLWIKGDTDLMARPSVAVVGARNCSSLGQRMAATLSKELGQAGVTVVSGLARGIDTAAHTAALDGGTVAVVAGGIDVVYPEENADLMAQIGKDGALVSEMPPGLRPQARHFPRRNRIISGLSLGVVVVEAAPKSGSLITARDAADQGREVMAVPGHPVDGRAAGCNLLIRDGATLVRGAADVLASLGLPDAAPVAETAATPQPRRQAKAAPEPASAGTAGSSRADPQQATQPTGEDAHRPPGWGGAPTGAAPIDGRILSMLGPTPLPEDQLMRDLGCGAGDLSEAILALEIDGKVERHPGGLIARCA